MTIMSPEGQRFPPRLPVTAVKTYQVAVPLATHWRPATCAEVDCPHHLHGWATTVLAGSADEAAIRSSGRHWATIEQQPGGFVRYVFPAGQACFAAARHKVPLERPGIYVVRDGDWRGNPTGRTRRHTRPEHWVEDFAEHQQQIADRIAAG